MTSHANVSTDLSSRIQDPTTLLAGITTLIFLALFGVIQHNLLLLAALLYALLTLALALRPTHHPPTETDAEAKPATNGANTDPDDRETQEIAALPNQIRDIAISMEVTVDGLVRSSRAIRDVIAQQADNATEQAEVIRSTNQLLDGFLEMTERISTQARAITQSAQQASDISQTGQQAIRETISSMNAIRQQVEAIAQTIVTLTQLTRRVDDIISSVGEIATQSNLLALNASIEAARAGAQGRGFAVVADEVRALSRQSTQAAEQVRGILQEIQVAMKQSVQATQTGIENVDAGVARTRQADDIMAQLATQVNSSRDAVQAIYGVIQQQASGMEEIAIGIDRIERITQQNVASTKTVETVSTNLTRLANELQVAVGQSPMPERA